VVGFFFALEATTSTDFTHKSHQHQVEWVSVTSNMLRGNNSVFLEDEVAVLANGQSHVQLVTRKSGMAVSRW